MAEPAELTEYAKKLLEEKGYERGPEGLMLPPPVEYPEYYPGYGRELTQLGVEYYRVQTQLARTESVYARAQQDISKAKSLGYGDPSLLGKFKLFMFRGPLELEAYEQQLEVAKQEFDLALQDLKAVEWRREVMVTMPNYLSIPDFKLQKAEDILQYIPLDAMGDEDTAWLISTFDRLQHLSNVLPEGFVGDAIEAQSKVLDEILTAPKLELRAVHNLTVEEIAKSFAFGVAELPEGMTEEQLRGMLGEMELMDEEMKDVKDWLADRAKDWALESDRLNLIRAGTVMAEVPELTPWEFTKLSFTQPMMATVELLDKYFNILARPLYAATLIGVHKLFKTPEDVAAARLEEQYNYFRSMGESSWSAYAKAFNEWDAPWWLKLGGEALFDPISYIGLGMATAASYKLGTGLTKVGLRGAGTRIGPWVGAVENGYVAGADAVFRAGVKVVLSPIKGTFWLTGAGYQIPRTFTTMARNFARESYMKFSSTLQRTFPEVRNLKGLTAKDAIDTGRNVIDQAIARPMEGWDAAVRAGAPMLEFNYIDDIAAARLVRDVVEEVTFDTNRLSRLNNEVLNMFSGQGERITAGKIIADLGQEATEDMVNKMSTKLVAFKQKTVDAAKAALKGDSANDVLMNMFNRLEGIRYTNLHSPLTKYMNQAGRSASWHSRVADRILYSSQLVALERRLVMPVARWNLLFANFGPYNFIENTQRSFLGGAEFMYPKAYSGVAETNRLFKGLANAPYDTILFERGEARLAQAVVDPKTGRTAIFKGGKVPFITREVVIPEKIPFLGGKTIGAKMNIAGRDHYLASFQDAYDMWAHFNSMQVAYDYQVHYMKALAEINPDAMRGLRDILAKRRGELDNIAAIHPRDARDIERVLMQDATISPEAVRAHSKIDVLEFERRQISKELGKTFDKCTDVRSITKKGIRDDVLDGSIFTDIDGKMAAYVESERELSLVSLKNQINVLKDEADAFLANPPRNLDEFLGDMQNITAMVEGTGERIHDYRRLTELRKAKLLPGEMDDFEVGSAKLLAEFMETSEEQLVKIMNQLVKNAKGVRAPIWRPSMSPADAKAWTSESSITATMYHGTGRREAGVASLIRNKGFTGKRAPGEGTAMYGEGVYLHNKEWMDYVNTARWTTAYPETLSTAVNVRNVYKLDLGNPESIREYARLVGAPEAIADDLDVFVSKWSGDLSSNLKAKGYGAVEIIQPKRYADWDKGTITARFGGDQTLVFESKNVTVTSKEIVDQPAKSLLSEVQLARLTDLDSISRLELENILATRNKIAEIEAIIPVTPKKSRTDRFWTQQRAQKATIWDEFDNNARKFKSLRLRSSRNFLDSVDGQAKWKPAMTSKDAAAWSEGSQIPETLYHGTDVPIAEVRKGAIIPEDYGFFTTRDPKQAIKHGENIVEMRASVRNLKSINWADEVRANPLLKPDEDSVAWNALVLKHKRAGHDALEVRGFGAEGDVVIVFKQDAIAAVDPSASAITRTSTKAFLPDFVPTVTTELTPNHLAYLFGATGDDLYRGLTRVQHHITIRPREDFILHTVEQADAYAATLGKTAADIGFTDDAIGEVYDQLWRNLGVEPTILTPDSPTVMQLEEIRQEITRLHGAYKLPGETMDWRTVTFEGIPDNLQTRVKSIIDELPIDVKFNLKKVNFDPNVTAAYDDVTKTISFKNAKAIDDPSNLYHELAHSVIDNAYERGEGNALLVRFLREAMGDEKMATKFENYGFRSYRESYQQFSEPHETFAEHFEEWVAKGRTGARLEEEFFAREFLKRDAPDVVKWRQYVNSVADDVEKLPMYKERLAPAIADIEVRPATVIRKGRVEEVPDILAITKAGEEIGSVHFKVSRDSLIVTDLGVYKAKTLNRGLLTTIGDSLDDIARQKGLANLKIEYIPRHKRLYLRSGFVQSFAEGEADLVMRPIAPRAEAIAAPDWWANKEAAMTKARDMHALAYPTYDDANIIDESMRALFPFWNYEMFRWRWIPRTAMRTPGTLTGLARYMEYTDQGYLSVPGTDLQMNPLRGSVWMGGLRSFYLRDFPEYYDVMPGMEFIDYIARAGFFPGIHVMLPIVAFGAATGKPEIGQLAPAWVRTSLSGLRTLSPEHIGAVLEHIYPDRFRDYMVMLTLGEEGYDADLIWRKKQTGEKLTPEEEKLWLDAVNRVDGVKGILMQQTGLFRIRPQEFTEIRREMRLAIEEATGVPVSVQEQIDRRYPVTGKRFSDYYHLDIYQQKLLYEWETYRRWQGVTTPLYPSSWQLLDVKIRDYYEELDKIYNEARTVGIYEDGRLIRPSMVEMNRQWVDGEIGPDQWMGFRSDLVGSLAEAARVLGESPAYKDVPKTFEERCKMLEERNIPTPTQTPDQELLYYYYELRPDYKWNWESQRMERDFDTYYAYIDILLESLDAPHRERLLQRIQADWTPLEKLYWQISREYMRPYRNLREIVLREYEPEQIQQIRRFEVAAATEREQLREIIGPEGDKLISGYQRRLREARQRFRILDPETDAWLNFFGTTTALLSTESKQIYEDLRKKYLTEDMIK